MAGRHCTICCDPFKLRRAAKLIAEGFSDQAAANVLGVGRMSMRRHRIGHVLEPAQALAEAAAKGRDEIARRREMIAAAQSGDPASYLSLAEIVNGLRRTDARLERNAAGAEEDRQRIAVSSLSAQQLKLAELRGKLGGHVGFGAAKAPSEGQGQRFSISIIFSQAGKVETIEGQVVPETVAIGHDESDAPSD